MIRKKDEQGIETKPNMRGGDGTVSLRALLSGDAEMNGKGRLFSHITLPPGASIGYHVHEKESETFYILSGAAQMDDNKERTVCAAAGDVLHTPPGCGHGLRNIGKAPLELVALILYE